MEFAQPLGLLSALSAVVIIALYSLRPRRQDRLVASNQLWREVVRDRQRGLGLQKLLREFSLLVMLLIAIVLSLALGGLGWSHTSGSQRDVVLIVDTSASMKTRLRKNLTSSTRFEEARRQALAIIDELPADNRLLLMTSARRAALRTAFESNRDTLKQAAQTMTATDQRGEHGQALALALALVRERHDAQVIFMTDGAFDGVFDDHGGRIVFRVIADDEPNLAVTRFDFRREIASVDRHQVLVTVRNLTDRVQSPDLTIYLGDRVLVKQTPTVAPGSAKTMVFPIQGPVVGLARVVLESDDGLDADNQAFAVIEDDEPLHLLLLSEGNHYLESVFNALPNVRVTHLSSVPDDFERQTGAYDVVVLDRIAPRELPAGSYLTIAVAPEGLPVAATGQVVTDQRVAGRGESPLVAGLDFSAVRIGHALAVSHDEGNPTVQRLLWSRDTDLALSLLEPGRRVVYLGFDLADSNLPLHSAFPIFLAESLAWLHPGAERRAQTQVSAGEPVTIVVPTSSSDLRITTPDGRTVRFDHPQAALHFRDTDQAGFYRYEVDGQTHYFAVNMTDEDESDVRTRATFTSTAPPTDDTATGVVHTAAWPMLVMVALILLGLEWLLWCWRGASA